MMRAKCSSALLNRRTGKLHTAACCTQYHVSTTARNYPLRRGGLHNYIRWIYELVCAHQSE